MKEKSRSTEIKIVVDAKDNNVDCVATVNVGSIDLDTTIELLQICIDELTKKKMEVELKDGSIEESFDCYEKDEKKICEIDLEKKVVVDYWKIEK